MPTIGDLPQEVFRTILHYHFIDAFHVSAYGVRDRVAAVLDPMMVCKAWADVMVELYEKDKLSRDAGSRKKQCTRMPGSLSIYVAEWLCNPARTDPLKSERQEEQLSSGSD